MRNYAQVRLDMRKHANARNIARLCTLGAAWRGGRIATRRLVSDTPGLSRLRRGSAPCLF
jgi:hypothetical protein